MKKKKVNQSTMVSRLSITTLVMVILYCLGTVLTLFLIKRERNGRAPVLPALLGCLLAACLDETIQIFVAGRGSSLLDVWIDFCGAAAGMAIVLTGYSIWKRKNNNENTEETT